MPKHKHRHRYCSVRRSGKRDSRNSSRDPVYLTDLDASLIEVNSRASCGDSPAPSSQRDELTSALREILFFMKEYTTPRIPEIDALGHIQDVVPEDIVPGNIVAKDMVTGHVMAEDTDPSLLGELQISHTEVNGQADRQTVLQNRGGEPVCFDPELQVGACLNVFGSGISNILKAYQGRPLQPNVKYAIAKLADDIHLLADHQYRLSLAR
ncbi:uncharacterized protein LOC120359212 isoform X2 [Solenopsis invicta]|uniref:uncharacterized protein LOC120359212 isoform X2 n=1 Tax=Solenopsis invicta TaxID=13686 RepID=UPI00193D2831|nr:uncharacterized protein LOC120359212 isoform X2 [Solenopsis invicta]